MKFKLYIIISLMLSLVGYGDITQREQLMDMIYSTPSQTPIKHAPTRPTCMPCSTATMTRQATR